MELWRVHDRKLELDGGQDLGRFPVERFADGEEAFKRRQMSAAFNRADLTYAQLGCCGDVFQAPVFFDTEEFDAVAEAFAETVLCGSSEAEGFDGVGHGGAELSEAERFGEVVEGFAL